MGPTRGNRKKGLFSKKAQVEVITVMLILAITVAAVFAAYRFAAPQIERSRDVSRINSMQSAFLELDNKIREVRFEGEGAQRYIDINFDKGNILVDQNDDTIIFYMAAPGIESAPQETGMDTYFTGGNINIKLQYGGEIEILSKFEVLNAGEHRIYIQNKGSNDVLLGLSPDIPVTGDTWTLQGYVYDNTEGGNNDGLKDENQPSMDNSPTDGKIFDAIDDPSLAGAEITFINKKSEIVAVTKTNSQGRYAVKIPKSDGVNDLELYVQVSLPSYIMKENDGASTIYSKADIYHLDFNKNLGTWHVNMNKSISKCDNDFWDSTNAYFKEGALCDTSPATCECPGFFNIPLYKLTKQDVFENVPIAIVLMDNTVGDVLNVNDTDYDNLLFDVMDAFDNAAGSSYQCNYFVVYGGTDLASGEGIGTGGGTWINYPDSDPPQAIRIYPLEWLLDPSAAKSPTDYGNYTIFKELATIGGNPDVLNYEDFSLIIVASGATNDNKVIEKLSKDAHKNELTNFLSQGRIKFKGVEYSRGLIVFGQFSEVNDIDPDDLSNPAYLPYPSLFNDVDPPRIQNINIVPDGQDGQNPSEFVHPVIWFNDYGGKAIFYAFVKDASNINYVGFNVLQSGTTVGGTILYDNGLGADRVSNDGTYTAEWTVPDTFTDGVYQVSVKAIDESANYLERSTFPDPVTNNPLNFEFEIRKDTVAPTNSSALSSSLAIQTTSPYTRITSSVQDALSGIERSTYGAEILQFDGHPLWGNIHTYYKYLPLSEGDIDYSVISYDRAQNPTTPQTIKILKDTSSPLVSDYLPQGTTLTSTPAISANYNDVGVGIRGSRLYLDSVNVNVNASGSSIISYTPALSEPDGTHTASVYVEDNLGNFLVFPWSFDINSEGPELVVTQPLSFLTFTNASPVTITGTSPVTGNITLDVNAGVSTSVVGPNFNFAGVNLNNGVNIIRIEADGAPVGDQNNTVETRWIVYDTALPLITINNPITGTPQNAKSGDKAYITFTYDEKYPASYTIKLLDGATLVGQTQTIINISNINSVSAGGTHQIMGTLEIPNSIPNGLYDVQITMTDLAGNVGASLTSNDIIRVKNYGPSLTGETPAFNATASPTAPIRITITDVNAGVDRNSIRMFILGQSYSNSSVINMEVTENLHIIPALYGYEIIYKPSWPWENTNKINVSVEASDKLGNKSSKSWYYITTSQSPIIKNLSLSSNRAAEGEVVDISFDVSQCSNNPNTYDAIKEINITIGKLGKIRYIPDGVAGTARLVRAPDSLPGTPADITVTYAAGGCTGGNLFTYSFKNDKKITFTVPDYAGDLNSPIIVNAINDRDWNSWIDSYLITSKHKYVLGTSYYYGKYSWLPKFYGNDLSIGRVSYEPVGVDYKIYGQMNDTHRMIPVVYSGWTKYKQGNTIVSEQWSGILYIDEDGNKIEWDHGKIPTVFKFDPGASGGQTWPPGGGGGPPFLPPDWLTINMDIDLSGRSFNVERYSLENPITNNLPSEFTMCAHGYFDLTDTGWSNNNIVVNLKSFQKIYQERGDPPTETLPPGLARKLVGGTILVPQANGGPVLLIKERRNSFNNLESCVVATTMDLDRYKNNRNLNGQNFHQTEIYGDLARNLEENIIVWACGHELLLD